MDSTKILKASFLDILFDERNKAYGAYELRSHYNRRVRNAVIGTSSIVLLLIGGYVLNNRLMAATDVKRPFEVKKEITLTEIPDIPEKPVVPPPPAVQNTPPPQMATKAFVDPIITTDDVLESEKPPKQSDLEHVAIGTKNIDGIEDNGIPAELAQGTGTGSGVITVEKGNAETDVPVSFVEIMPEFPGGEEALMKYLKRTTRYPQMAMENEIQGIVYVQFVVNRDGSISDIKTLGAQKGGGLEEEAMRVVKGMPKWKPGRQNGKNVSVYFNLPINFKFTNQ
jgi:protein TonB